MTNLLTGKTIGVGSSGTTPVSGCGTATPRNPSRINDGDALTYSDICNALSGGSGTIRGYWTADLGAAYDVDQSIVNTTTQPGGGGTGGNFAGLGIVSLYHSATGTSGPWTLAATFGGWTSTQDEIDQIQSFASINARYWKLEWVCSGFTGGLQYYVGIQPNDWQLVQGTAVAPTAVGWDVYDGGDPNGDILDTITEASERSFRVELNGPGSGRLVINRHSGEAAEATFTKGNLVKIRIPDLGEDYVAGFFVESGDFELLSPDEEGGEELTFGGRGLLAYLDRARMWFEAFTTGTVTNDTWTEIWEAAGISKPTGTALYDSNWLWVIHETTRRVYRISQTDQHVQVLSDPLFSGYAGGLSMDPADSAVYWALEAPWLSGSSSNTKIHKIRQSDHVILATFDMGSAIKFTSIKVSATWLWATRWDGSTTIYRLSKATGAVSNSYSISYGGSTQVNPSGISVNGTSLAYWYDGTKRALLADESAPTTITGVLDVTGISSLGGDWTTEGGNDYLYMDSASVGRVWKYQITSATPVDPVDGIWRLDEASAGAVLERVIGEAQDYARPQQPLPDLTRAFDFTNDSDGSAWYADAGVAEFTAQIGESVLSVALRLIRYGLTIQMFPTLEIGGYNGYGTDRSSATFATGKIRFEAGVNIAEGLKRQMGARRVDSVMLAEGEGDIFATATQNDLGYVQEGYLATRLQDADALEGTADVELTKQRAVSESLQIVAPWGNDEANGHYLPYVHYWVGDTVRIHTGTSAFDYNEVDARIYAVTITELENGDWEAVLDLAEGPVAETTAGGTSGDGGSTSVGGTAVGSSTSAVVTVEDTANSDEVQATRLSSPDWSVTEPASREARIRMRWPILSLLADLDIAAIVDRQGITWDASESKWIPGDVIPRINALGSVGSTATADPADGEIVTATLTEDCTLTLDPPTGNYASLVAWVTQDGTGGWDLTLAAGGGGSFAWDGGTTPSPDTTAGVTVRYIFETVDGGANWVGNLVGGSAADVQDAGRWEVIMAPGVTSPPDPVQTPDGDDWVYGWVSA